MPLTMSKSWNNSPKNRPENKCQECGCHCESCVDINSIHLHQEIEDFKSRLNEKEQQIVTMESQILMHANQVPQGEMQAVRESLYFWQDKYERLLENYRKLQKVNQGLEDKLLRIADKFENEKISLTHNVAELTGKLTSSQMSIASLQQESEQYKNDCNLAIRMLQCKPSQFVSQKLDSLPSDVQERVQQHFNYCLPASEPESAKAEVKPVRVPIPTFPPTAVMFSLNKNESQPEETANYVSAAMMANILEQREKERLNGNKYNGYSNESYLSTCQTSYDRNEYLIQMDDQRRANVPTKNEYGYHSGQGANLQPNSQTLMRGSNSKSIQNETIII